MSLPSLRSLFSFNTTGALSVLLVLAMLALAWAQRQPLPVNAAVVQLPQWDETLWESEAGRLEDLAQRFAADQARMDLAAELRIRQWMEDAWEADLESECADHLPHGIQLVNEFPTLLSAWRVLWHCWETDEDQHQRMQQWIVALMTLSESHTSSQLRHYPERALAVHNLTDALSYVDLGGNTVIDSWFETIADGELLRVGVLLWDEEQEHDTRWYFDPVTTQQLYSENWPEDPFCQANLAVCMVSFVGLSGYTSPAVIARALLQQADGNTLRALTLLRSQVEVSAEANLLLFDLLTLKPNLKLAASELALYARKAVELDSSQGKLLLSLIKSHGLDVVATEQASDDETDDVTDGEDGESASAADATSDELWQDAQAELSYADLVEYWAFYNTRIQAFKLSQAESQAELPEQAAEQRDYWAEAADVGSPRGLLEQLSAALDQAPPEEKEQRQRILSQLVRSANGGNRVAMYQLGRLFAHAHGLAGNWVEYDLEKAQRWLRRAAETGYGPALELRVSLLAAIAEPTVAQKRELEQSVAQGVALHLPVSLMQQLAWVQADGVTTDPMQIRRWLLWAAAWDHAPAQLALAQHYLGAPGFPADPESAQSWFEEAAELGSAEASYQLALMLAAQRPGLAGQVKAAKALARAAEAGHAASQLMLSEWIRAGIGDSLSAQEALGWLRRAAEQGHGPALAHYAQALSRELVNPISGEVQVPADPEAAYQYWQRLAMLNEPEGHSGMGMAHLLGQGAISDPQRALRLLYQGVRGEARYEQGIRLLERHPGGLAGDSAPLLAWAEQEYQRLSLASDKESGEKESGEGESSGQRQKRNAERDHLIRWANQYLQRWSGAAIFKEAAERWLDRGAEAGLKEYAWQRAQRRSWGGFHLNPGSCADFQRAWDAGEQAAFVFKELCPGVLAYWYSLPPTVRPEKGFLVRESAIEDRIAAFRRAHELGIPDAELDLASCLLEAANKGGGEVFEQEGIKMLRLLAQKGDITALNLLGVHSQFAAEADVTSALSFYRQAAQAGDSAAQNNFGRLLMSLEPGSAQAKQGEQWVYWSHLQGNAAATDTLGEAHEYGWLGEPDWQQAVYYYDLAGAAGQGLSYVNAARLWIKGGHGLKESRQQAVVYVTKAWEMGYLDEPRVDLGEVTVELTFGDTTPDA